MLDRPNRWRENKGIMSLVEPERSLLAEELVEARQGPLLLEGHPLKRISGIKSLSNAILDRWLLSQMALINTGSLLLKREV